MLVPYFESADFKSVIFFENFEPKSPNLGILGQNVSHHISYVASQKYTVIIIKDLQYTYETLRLKITSFL